MKLARLSNLPYALNLGKMHLGSSSFYSTMSRLTTQKWSTRRRGHSQLNQLYRRISPVGDPKVSIVPILDQWIQEGKSVNKDQLQIFIKELRSYKRYTHALEISMWMTDKRYYELTARDIAIRLDLMSKVFGIEEAEKYFDNIPQQLKGLEVHGALLNCYAYANSVDKAEAVMQKMRDLGFAMTSLSYNVMLNLYYRTGHMNKFDSLMREMEENGIAYDKFTLGLQLSAYAAVSDIKGMEKILSRMESDAKFALEWANYAIMANGYTKAGLVEKAVEMLKKSEGLITSKRRSTAYNFLLTQYATTGKKDEVLRIWELYKKKETVYNNGYMNIIRSLLKFDDFENVEKIFEEWESRDLTYDIHIPNILIGAYSRKGLVKKAETLVDRAIAKGGKPDAYTWYCLNIAYLKNNQYPEAIGMIKKAIGVPGSKFRPDSESLASCLEYLKGQGDLEKAEEFIRLLADNDIISLDIQGRLLENIRAGKLHSDTHSELSDNSVFQNEDELEFSESRRDSSDLLSEEKC